MIVKTIPISAIIIRAAFMRIAKGFIAPLTFAAILAACSAGKEDRQTAETFPVMQPAIVDTVFAKEYVADIQSIQNVELRARINGFVEKIHVDEGQTVKANQVLFTIGNQVFQEDLKRANALLKSTIAEAKVSEVEVMNARKLVERNIVSQTELDMAEAKLEAIQARIDEACSAVSTAQLNVSFAEVRAPFNGVINRIPNKAGSLIEEGTLLTTLSNNNEMFAYFNLSEQEYLDFVRRMGTDSHPEVSLITADNRAYSEKGRIETIESEINKHTGTLAFRARFTNPSQLLKHGSSGKVLLNTELKNAMLIPQKSTFEIQENLYVYVVNKDHVVEMRSIVPRLSLPHLYVVQSGLSAGETFIFEGIQRVKDGDRITPKAVTFNRKAVAIALK